MRKILLTATILTGLLIAPITVFAGGGSDDTGSSCDPTESGWDACLKQHKKSITPERRNTTVEPGHFSELYCDTLKNGAGNGCQKAGKQNDEHEEIP